MGAATPPSRCLGELTFAELGGLLRESSILCLPMGAMEQHGRHLPLNTDAVIAEELARRIVARWGDEFDLWLLPTIFVGLSREHDWAPGTLSLSIQSFAAVMTELAREIVRSLPARNLLIVNGHGGNRGVLGALMLELHSELRLNACAIHPFDLSRAASSSPDHDVHGGSDETSVMLAIAPHLVRDRSIASAGEAADPTQVDSMIFDRGVSFPWRTDDDRIARLGVIGDPKSASAKLGHTIVESVIMQTRAILARLLENQHRSGSVRAQRQGARRGLPARTSRRSGSRRQRRGGKS
ncbi:MAG TPA: creatininase family protein [Xanthobacteraceae bacterium]|jgi:creatinine amidohydrolase/Fe(II)-dependent formamide hydrolase-like protein